ncbi:6-phospho-beta-glucosidase [Streptoalloteichus tenebrarius]|uniref:6-phospho-beta-glucosidase n=1 Tax=Streptoalloteichus tenebrarius (strain ATCC 17920 / DSM 40477 / JCM 4838 / CBS 697.72 / NBRC 16177 / NCIMB 11028 / NRRL B-12390 / A12253. 1 / ISP 5477) TaxID=1933 RepID=A0ABT1HYN8_STRSD|nr:6-phospho-beta-glucosidase [Streptoalloteichus tenebrarius]MCP2260633.1 6-phospho-beta-glucosidase [Streptoalloteichus tenebrarius]
MKLTVVGGGSTYTPELVDGIAHRLGGLEVDEIALVDPDEERLAVVGPFCQRLLAAAGHPAVVRTTSDLERGADGATAVLLQLRVGGQSARHSDETFPLECGCVGQETTGAGGLAKALRTVPVVLDIAERVRAVAGDNTWLVNFTNPVGIVTRALLEAGHRALGLCNVAIGFERWFAEILGVAPENVYLEHVGLNHLTWERGVLIKGPNASMDVLPALLQERAGEIAERVGLPVALLHRLGAIPSYYLRYFYQHDQVVAEQRGERSRAEVVADVERELLRVYADPAVSTKPELLGKRGGAYYSEAAIQLVDALVNGGGASHVVNVRNGRALPFLPEDAVVEIPCTIDTGGAVPSPVRPVPPAMAGLIAHVAAYEALALDAAVHGGRDRVADALLAHPLVGQHEKAERLTDSLLAANAAFLPWAKG